MATIGELVVAIKANADGFTAGLQSAEKAMEASKMKLDGLKGAFNSVALISGAVVGAFALMAKSAMDEDAEISKLARTVSKSDEQFQKTRATLGAWADEMENKYPYSAEQYAGAVQMLVVRGHVPLDKAMASSTALLGFMADTGMQSKKALMYIHDEAKRGRDVLQEWNDKVEFGLTPAQKMIVLQQKWGNVLESIGSAVIPMMIKLADGASWLIDRFNEIPAPVRDIATQFTAITAGGIALTAVIARVGLGFITTISQVMPLIKGLGVALNFLAMNPIGLVITGIGLVILALTTNFMGARDKAVGIITGLGFYFKALGDYITTIADAMSKAMRLDFDGARKAIVDGITRIGEDIEKGNKAIVDGWTKSNKAISESDKEKEKDKRQLIKDTTALLKTKTSEETAMERAQVKDAKEQIKELADARKTAYDNDKKDMDSRVLKVHQTNKLIEASGYLTLTQWLDYYQREKDAYRTLKDYELTKAQENYTAMLAQAGTNEELIKTAKQTYNDQKLVIEQDFKDKSGAIDEEMTNKKVAELKKTKDEWATTYEEIGTSFGTAVGKMITAGTTLKDGLEVVWDEMKKGFLKIVKNMIKDYISAWFDAEIAKASAEAVVTKGMSAWKVPALIAGKFASLGAIDAIIPYAQGGYVTKPTLAMVGEGGEPEYIIPASKMGKVFPSNSSKNISININGGNKSGYQIYQEIRPYIEDTTSINKLGKRSNYR